MIKGTEKEGEEDIPAFLKGAGLGATISALCYPLNLVKTHMQLAEKQGKEFQQIKVVAREIYLKFDGRCSRMYYGVAWSAARGSISWGIINFVYHKIKTSDFL